MSTITKKHLFPGTLHNSILYNMYLKNQEAMALVHKSPTIQVCLSQLMRKKKVAFFFSD